MGHQEMYNKATPEQRAAMTGKNDSRISITPAVAAYNASKAVEEEKLPDLEEVTAVQEQINMETKLGKYFAITDKKLSKEMKRELGKLGYKIANNDAGKDVIDWSLNHSR